MGFYVNPSDRSKEAFLMAKGVAVMEPFKWADLPTGSLPVVLVKNPHFTAAGIAYSESELQEFTRRDDRRPRSIYIVKVDDLMEVADEEFRRWARNHFAITT